MATSEQDIVRELEAEREKLTEAVDTLREELGEATNISEKLRSKLPAVAAGALGLGFVVAGGIGATARLLMRRGREGKAEAKVGRFSLIRRR
jgi:hypothetical protein